MANVMPSMMNNSVRACHREGMQPFCLRLNLVQVASAIVVAMCLSHVLQTPTYATTSNESIRRPNIVLIMADDMNYECCCGEEIARENHCFSPSSEMN